MYSLNPSLYASGVFVPGIIAQKYIKMASFCALKTLLWICSHQSGDFSVEELASAVGSSPADTKEALEYWISEGILVEQGGTAKAIPEPTSSDIHLAKPQEKKKAEKKEEPKQDISVKLPSPSMSEISEALENDKEFSSLCKQLQTVLGDFGFSIQSAIYLMLRGYGLAADMVFILVNYCVQRDKKAAAFMLGVAKDWYKKDITTHESAYEYIDSHNKTEKIYQAFKLETGMSAPKATPTQENYFAEWDKMGFDVEMMVLAYNRTVDKTGKINFNYTNKILQGWHENGLKTPEDVEKFEKQYSDKKKQAKKGERSYDVEKAKRDAKNKKIVYED